MRFLSALMPREGQFFALFNKHANLTAEGARALSNLLQNYDDVDGRAALDSDDSGCRTHGGGRLEIG